jgi:peroxiredoxin
MYFLKKTAFCVIATAVLTGASVYAMAARQATSQKLKKAPDFVLKNYDGNVYMLSELKGKIVVLEWFNYECPFLRYNYEKTSVINDLVNKYKDKNVVWLAINSTGHQNTEKNKEFAEEFKVTHPILDDASGIVAKAYGAKTTPHIFIIDAKGDIVYNGALDNAPLGKVPKGEKLVNYVDKALAELTQGKPVSTPTTKPYGCSVKYGK